MKMCAIIHIYMIKYFEAVSLKTMFQLPCGSTSV